MTKIKYEGNAIGCGIELEGSGKDLFKAACRIIANVKETVKLDGVALKENVDFDKMLLEGIEKADEEMKLNKKLETGLKGKKLEKIDDLLKAFEELIND